jgi:hypothetical protein
MVVTGSSVFTPEDGSSRFLRNIVLPDRVPKDGSLRLHYRENQDGSDPSLILGKTLWAC